LRRLPGICRRDRIAWSRARNTKSCRKTIAIASSSGPRSMPSWRV